LVIVGGITLLDIHNQIQLNSNYDVLKDSEVKAQAELLSLIMLFKNKTGSGRKKQRLIGMWMEIGTITIIIQ
jgi:hypothetical protein